MGDIKFELNLPYTRALSPPELYPNLGSPSLFSPDSLTMQDDMLLEKSAGKLHMQQLSPNPDQSSDNSEEFSSVSKAKSGDSSPLTVPEKNKSQPDIDHPSVTSAVLLQQQQQQLGIGLHHPQQPVSLSQLHQQESANSVISSNTATVSSVFNTPSFWSTANSDETFFQNIPAMNGAMHQFQNFPLNSSPLFSPTLSPQAQAQLNMQQAAHRRSLPPQPSAPQQNLFPTSSQLQQAQLQAGNLLLANKHLSWNAGQPTSWNTAQQSLQQQTNPWGTVGSPSSAAQTSHHRRSMPPLSTHVSTPSQSSQNSLGLSPNKMKATSNPIISPPKFHRSTSLPGKSYSQPHLPSTAGSHPTHQGQTTFDFPRDVGGGGDAQSHTHNGTQNGTHHLSNNHLSNSTLFPFQDNPGQQTQTATMDHLKLASLEHQLFDIMRSADRPSMEFNTRGTWSSALFPGSDNLLDDGRHDQIVPSLNSPGHISPRSVDYPGERYSRKVFVGGLPPDIDEDEITASFRRFGSLVVDWPHKAESKSYFPPKGYAFLLFQDERSVQALIDACIKEEDKLYLCVSSPTIKDKPVQIRPWNLADSDFVLDGSQPLDPRKTIFVGGVPRPLRAVELAMIMDRLYGGVCYAGIDTDPELKYPKGAGRVAFASQQSYIAAISARFVQLQHGDIDKRVEVKPYVLDDQMCDECQGTRCGGKFAPFFCANVTCLQYYCEFCWATIHSRPGREFHKPLVKEGGDRPRSFPFRW
ncbi:LOW QUALITY PROTEIN: cytoplasmic polyadenylation element-binding protein 3-like [Diadema antillarum]|uniref:LOW QUALITY PROTEIN: cytoplasmic polyadenylation element-binding protein 3-like n=1 Tax=Diadema antillarum TaxID=105358 RepID=UPI003A8BA524